MCFVFQCHLNRYADIETEELSSCFWTKVGLGQYLKGDSGKLTNVLEESLAVVMVPWALALAATCTCCGPLSRGQLPHLQLSSVSSLYSPTSSCVSQFGALLKHDNV